MEILILASTGALGLLLFITVWNLLRFKSMSDPHALYRGSLPMVSVLIPARNEERGIEACVRSVCSQDHHNLEVIVLDDGSTDRTPEILKQLQSEYPHLRVITGQPLPDGWVGKVWACHQLSQVARGEVLLFTDADTHHHPNTVSSAVRTLQNHHFDFFSIITHQELGSFAEHAVIPIVHVMFFAFLPSDLVIHHPSVSASAANGQFMCFTRSAYDKIGGHTCVQNAMVEDVSLARVIKRAGLRMGLVDGIRYVSCRMYTNATEVTNGFAKNFFAGTGYNVPVMLLLLAFFATAFVAPLVLAPFRPELAAIPLTLAAVIRGTISLRFRMPIWHAVIMPISAVWVILIGIKSMIWAFSSTGSQWKGRSYGRPARQHA